MPCPSEWKAGGEHCPALQRSGDNSQGHVLCSHPTSEVGQHPEHAVNQAGMPLPGNMLIILVPLSPRDTFPHVIVLKPHHVPIPFLIMRCSFSLFNAEFGVRGGLVLALLSFPKFLIPPHQNSLGVSFPLSFS